MTNVVCLLVLLLKVVLGECNIKEICAFVIKY